MEKRKDAEATGIAQTCIPATKGKLKWFVAAKLLKGQHHQNGVCVGRPLVNGLVLMYMWPLRDFTFFQTQKAFKHNSNKNNVRYRVESKLSAAQDSVDCRLYSVESRLSPVRDSVESQSGVLSGRTLSHKECAKSQHF